jgi:hypothetical protein
MDQFAAHTADSVVAEAEALDIEIIWVPKGATGRHWEGEMEIHVQ